MRKVTKLRAFKITKIPLKCLYFEKRVPPNHTFFVNCSIFLEAVYYLSNQLTGFKLGRIAIFEVLCQIMNSTLINFENLFPLLYFFVDSQTQSY